MQDIDGDVVSIGSPLVPEGKQRLGPVPPTLTFARVPEGKVVKNRVHLDVNPTDREQAEEVQRLGGQAPVTPTSAKARRAGSPSPTPRATSSAS